MQIRVPALCAALLAVSSTASPAAAQTVTVTTLEDAVDVPPTATASSLPGADGRVSFREALLVTNNMPGPQTVAFAIPQSEWWLVGTYALLRLESGVFLVTDDGTTLDFSTQTAFTGDTNPNGMEVGIYGLEANGWGVPAILIDASNCVVRGLGMVHQRSAAVWIGSGTGNRVVGCVSTEVEIDPYPGTTSFNVVGGTLPGEGNVLASVEIFCGADDNLVIGNQLETARVVGSPFCTLQYPRRNRIGGPTPAERNVLSGAGYYGEEGFPVGRNVEVLWARDTVVEGNYIGVTPDGTARVPQVAPVGISVADSLDTLVRDNLVSGIYVVGVNHYQGEVFGTAISVGAINADNQGVRLEGNLVGTDLTGTQPIQTYSGIRVAPSTGLRSVRDVRIGGPNAGQANRVAFTWTTGIAVSGDAQVELAANSIEDNALLGIDLGSIFLPGNGVDPNDRLDGDQIGGNPLQNHPELELALGASQGLKLRGRLRSEPARDYRVEFFASPTCDVSGYGEGATFLGSIAVSTDANGDAPFAVALAAQVPVGHVVTSTATDLAAAATSEFGNCVEVRALHASGNLHGL